MNGPKALGMVALALAVLFGAGCARYQRRPLSFRMPSSYPNHQTIQGAELGARAITDRQRAKEAFGFDIIGAGVLPVQVVIKNGADWPLQIVADQSFLVESDGRMWPVLSAELARERIAKHTGWGELAPGAAKGAVLGAAAGAVIGTAVGVVSGKSVGGSAAKGAVVGAAGGGVLGGANAMSDQEVARNIATDLRDASLRNKQVPPGQLGQGILFFPAEARSPAQLELQVKNARTGKVYTLKFSL